jgi:hypothetical protein
VRALLIALSMLIATPAAASGPVVVELFTSQGCEECWRANAVVGGLAERPDVLPLTISVDYWDYLGWEDTFARPEFAMRQRAYGRALKLRGLQTPLAVIDGRASASGLQRGKLVSMIRARHASDRGKPTARFLAGGERAAVSAGRVPEGGAEVWLVRFDPKVVRVPVTRGPNKGRTIPHRNVVREMVKLGDWTGRSSSYALPEDEAPAGLRTAVLVQAVSNREILAAAVAG